MPIQNIQGLVDKNGLTYIPNFTRNYYEEGLANLGQRNTNDSILENVTFTIADIFSELKRYITNNSNPYLYIIYYQDNQGKIHFYTLNETNIKANYNDPINISDLQDIIAILQSENIDTLKELGYIIELNTQLSNSGDNTSLILNKQLNIISELFDYINNPKDENGNPLKDENGYDIHPIRKNKLFIPVNYQFGYIANGINKSTIYHSFKDIYVNVITEGFNNQEDDYELEDKNFYLSNIFYCSQQSFIKTDVYEYIFKQEENDERVVCSLKFTLPYINNDDYWVINGQKTSIQAKAHDAVNLNIILAYYHNVNGIDTYEYLSGLNNNFKTEQISYQSEPTTFKVKNGKDIITCAIKTPIIKKTNLTKDEINLNTVLQNSTLIIISKITDIFINGKNVEKFGNGFVTTMWHYQDDEFKIICAEDDIALDFNQLTNFENLLKYEIQNVNQVTPDNFLYRHLIFDQIYQQLKQDNKQSLYSYPVLQNIKGSQYNNKYSNNMNFSLKYINYISGEINKDIKGVSKSSDIKYLNNNSNVSNITNIVTNALYQYTTNNKVNYYNEYIPNYNVPLFDLSEILVKDFNVLNKTNIITFDYDGTTYYSYIGSTHQTPKNILTIGSSNLDINLGENTLTDYHTKSNFKIQPIININFDTINANGNLNVSGNIDVEGDIILNKFEWNKSEINGIEIQSTSFVPQFKYYTFNNDLNPSDNKLIESNNIYKIIWLDNLESDIKSLSRSANDSNLRYGSDAAKQYLYISPIIGVNSLENQMRYYYKYNDLLVLPNLVKYLGLDINVTDFESNTNEIIKIDGQPLYLVSSNNILADSISIVGATDIGVAIDTLNTNEFYLGNTLYVTYIKSLNKLIVNEVQSNKIKSIWKIPTEIN